MNSVKAAVRLLSPPILWDLGRKLKSKCKSSKFQQVGVFRGPMASWKEAVAHSDGWDSSAITEKTLEVALKVRDGLVEFEQDTIIGNKINYSPTILAFILLNISRHKDKLSIIDYGGSLGTNYFQNRKILQHLVNTTFTWNIVERPVLAKLGREHFATSKLIANSALNFFSSLEKATRGLVDIPDSVLFSGSLQYVPEPLSLLDQVISVGAKIIAFDRLLVSPEAEHAVFIQHPDPTIYYPATYPVWCFSRDLFIENLVSKGFTLVEHFTNDPDAHFDHCGMIFTLDR